MDSQESPTYAPAANHGLNILIVDDNPINRRVVALQLEQLGFTGTSVDGGEHAILAVKSKHYHLILMDVQMPGMDGLTATRRLLSTIPLEDQPLVVAMTGSASEEDRESCMEAGMLDIVSKPIRTAELVRVVRAAREGMTLSASNASTEAPLGGLIEAFSSRPEVICRLVDDYIQDAEAIFETIKCRIETRDRAGLEEKAHALKGTAGQMGAKHVALFAALVERAARRGSFSYAAACAEQLGGKLSVENQELRKVCERFRPRANSTHPPQSSRVSVHP